MVRKGCDNTTFIQNFAGPWRDWSGRLLVIDEVSTCGAAAFEIVSRRMQQMARVLWRRHFATPPPEEMAPFGGIGVVLMGHFAQLPHPSRPACFRTCHGAPNNLYMLFCTQQILRHQSRPTWSWAELTAAPSPDPEPPHAHKARILGVSLRLAPADVLGRTFIELLMEVGKRAILLEHGVHPMICNENVSLTRQRIHGRCRCETGGRTTVVVVPTHCKLSPTGPVQGGLHLHPVGRHLRLGPWSTPRVWPGGCL